MILKKTDRRFKIYKHGFDCYIECDVLDSYKYRKMFHYYSICLKLFGDPFSDITNINGKYKFVSKHKKNSKRTATRIYFRGEKIYTMFLMSIDIKNE